MKIFIDLTLQIGYRFIAICCSTCKTCKKKSTLKSSICFVGDVFVLIAFVRLEKHCKKNCVIASSTSFYKILKFVYRNIIV